MSNKLITIQKNKHALQRRDKFDEHTLQRIKDCPGYQIDINGRIVSYIKNNQMFGNRPGIVSYPVRIMKVSTGKDGYLQVGLVHEDGKRRTKKIHRLLAEAFIPNPCLYPYVCHRDDKKSNNTVSNLYWGTHKENSEDAVKNKVCRQGDQHYRARLSDQEVCEIRRIYKTRTMTMSRIANRFNVSTGCISGIVNMKTRRYI